MPRLSSLLPVLALASLVRGQNASSTSGTAATAATPASTAAPASETVVTLPALETREEGQMNSTITAVWSTDTGRGTLTQGLTLLQNSTQTAQNQSVYGVVLEFNSTLAVSKESQRTNIPWIAYISCDDPSSVVTQYSDGALSASAGLPSSATGSAASAAATGTSGNSAAANGTTQLNSTSVQLETLNLMERAEQLGAQAILLYSEVAQSCTLNYTAFNYTNFNSSTSSSTNSSLDPNSTLSTTLLSNASIPIFTSPSTQVTNIILSQFTNLPPTHSFFNSTLLAEATGNLSSVISAATNSSSSGNSSSGGGGISLSSPTQFLLARIRPFYDSTSSYNGIVATIGVANPTTQQPTATGSTGAAGPSQSGGGGGGGSNAAVSVGRERKRSLGKLAVTGFVVGAVTAGVGALV